jgi:hypothetical protein
VNEFVATTGCLPTRLAISSPATSTEVIAGNLDKLFSEKKASEGRKATNQQVAEYVTRITGNTCHRTWIAKLRGGKVTAPNLDRLDAVAAFFGHTRTDLMTVADRHEPADQLWRLGGVAERLKNLGIDLAQLASLAPDDIRHISVLVRRLATQQAPPSDPP